MENMHNDVRVLRVNYFFLIECFSIGCRTTKITVITTAADESSNFLKRGKTRVIKLSLHQL